MRKGAFSGVGMAPHGPMKRVPISVVYLQKGSTFCGLKFSRREGELFLPQSRYMGSVHTCYGIELYFVMLHIACIHHAIAITRGSHFALICLCAFLFS